MNLIKINEWKFSEKKFVTQNSPTDCTTNKITKFKREDIGAKYRGTRARRTEIHAVQTIREHPLHKSLSSDAPRTAIWGVKLDKPDKSCTYESRSRAFLFRK